VHATVFVHFFPLGRGEPGSAERITRSNHDWRLTVVTSVSFDVSYGQFGLFASSLKQPFNDWTEQHVSQGFAWRPGSVSFRTLLEAGPHSIEINLVEHAGIIDPMAVRAIEVPFEVPADGALGVGSITDTVPISLPPGSFLLRCEFLRASDAEPVKVRLTFAKDEPRFAVVRADPELSIGGQLLTSAQPAHG
jgi:hypothetical protein